mgnify:CR=1 FL=1
MDAPPWVFLDPSERAMSQQIRVFALGNGAATTFSGRTNEQLGALRRALLHQVAYYFVEFVA